MENHQVVFITDSEGRGPFAGYSPTLARICKCRDQLNYKTRLLQNSNAYFMIVEILVKELWHASKTHINFGAYLDANQGQQMKQ